MWKARFRIAHAHRHLILHRDLKPGNVLVTTDGVVKLLDFDTASLLENGPSVTVTRARMLTPRYASPEQLRGERPGITGDVFSLGVILYERLTWAWPFGDPDSHATPTSPQAAVTTEALFPPSKKPSKVIAGSVPLMPGSPIVSRRF